MKIDVQTVRILLAWGLVGGGIFIAYSVATGQKPTDVLADRNGEPLFTFEEVGIGSGLFGSGPDTGLSSGLTGSGGMSGPDSQRAQGLADRSIKPDLRPIPGGGSLDKVAAASFRRVTESVGYTIPNVGAYRSYAWQAAQHAANPGRFADPDGSLHVVGLAIDLHANYRDRPEVIQAMQNAGWVRYDPSGESWHWSYLVRG